MNKHTTHRFVESAAQSTQDKRPSKHKRRKDRREKYYEMIDRSLPEERHFAGRIIDTVNRDGMDIALDGRPIKSYWRHYMKTRRKYQKVNTLACLYLLDKTYRAIRPTTYL
jgi:hypothetical protein